VIQQAASERLHWNYFLALEQDMERTSRYIEFSPSNFSAYSIELAHLLFAAASEVDVVGKALCAIVAPDAPRGNINDYRAVLGLMAPHLHSTRVFVPRYGLTLVPWKNWGDTPQTNPDWWMSYNRVKHARDAHFQEATLLVVIYELYRFSTPNLSDYPTPPAEIAKQLDPESALLRLSDDHYFSGVRV
jgi:hypothetical protein